MDLPGLGDGGWGHWFPLGLTPAPWLVSLIHSEAVTDMGPHENTKDRIFSAFDPRENCAVVQLVCFNLQELRLAIFFSEAESKNNMHQRC